MKKASIILTMILMITSCVSKKKFLASEKEKGELKSELTKTQFEKEELEGKFAIIQERVDNFNNKISNLTEEVGVLTAENDSKISMKGDVAISNNAKNNMLRTLEKVDAYKLNQAKTLKDSMNLAVAHNLKENINSEDFSEDEDISVNIGETVVMISISDKMLFNSGSYRISSKADGILQKLADVINSEPSLEVMVEGHTDSRTINTERVKDNWDLSVLRATSVVRRLQSKFNVSPDKLIASGRSSYIPLTDNDTSENRARNRRTRIVILPNMDKFLAMIAQN